MTLLKLCGLTNLPDVDAAASLRPDFAGIVLWPRSKRAVADPGPLCDRLREHGIPSVAVVVDGHAAEIDPRVRGFDIVQLHGEQTTEDIAALTQGGHRVWRALRTGPDFDVTQAHDAWKAGAEFVLLDAWHPTEPGGTGLAADRHIAAALAAEGPLFLAGGLTPSNVAEAIASVRPEGVDVSSGIEASPGQKDSAKMRAFVTAVRGESS